jgi:hypothetical protein
VTNGQKTKDQFNKKLSLILSKSVTKC